MGKCPFVVSWYEYYYIHMIKLFSSQKNQLQYNKAVISSLYPLWNIVVSLILTSHVLMKLFFSLHL